MMTAPCRNPLHLYRALLRESSYLFHPAAQEFHHRHITWSFRRQQVKEAEPRATSDHDGLLPLLSKNESRQMRRGRRYLYMLQRANQGYTGAVLNVLKMTFARKGKRRRELLKEIMAPSPADIMGPDQGAPSPTLFSRHWRPPAKFTMLLRSQSKLQSFLDARGRIKPQPKVPERNRWNKPFPESRIKGMMREWYAKHADTLLPPLEEQEWLAIYKTATDPARSNWNVPQRRRQASVPVFASMPGSSDLFDISSLVKTSPQAVEPQHSKRISAILRNPHHLTPRYMRRMMVRTLQNIPTPLANPDTGKLAMRWESGIKPRKEPGTCTDSQKITLFD